MNKRRCPEIDVLYAIGTVLVVFGHSHSSDWSTFSGTILNTAIVFIYTFHMPLFFFIAGFLFMNSDSLERMGYGRWLSQKAERLLMPYIVLSVVALIPKYYVENHSFNGLMGYLAKAVFVPRIGVWGHFWFLPVLLMLFLFFGLWKRMLGNGNVQDVLAGTALMSIVLYFFPYATEWFGFRDFKEAVLYFVLGMVLNCWTDDTKRTQRSMAVRYMWIAIGTAVAMILVRYSYGVKVVMLITAIIMISVSWQIATLIGENKLCKWISDNNFTIYIYSWPFQATMMVIAGRLGFSWYMITLSMFIVGITAPILMVLVYKKLKVLNNRFFDLLIGIK